MFPLSWRRAGFRPYTRKRALGPERLAALVAIVGAGLIATPGAHAASPCGTNGVLTVSSTTATCTYTKSDNSGYADTFTVPASATSLSVVLVGGRGGKAVAGACASTTIYLGGAGGRVVSTLSATPGSVFDLILAGNGLDSCSGGSSTGGFGGGGVGGQGSSPSGARNGGSGGGASRISLNGVTLVVAGGGGGSAPIARGGAAGEAGADGGSGGAGPPTGNGYAAGGGAGTLTAGGAADTDLIAGVTTQATAGTLGQGGRGASNNSTNAGGGGGGGLYGGGGGSGNGGGSGAGGGGGSSYSAGTATIGTDSTGVPTVQISWPTTQSATLNLGVQTGAGDAWLTPQPPGTTARAAAVFGTVGTSAPTGTVTYVRYFGDQCLGTPAASETVAVTASVPAISTATGPLASGTYSFRATYNGDASYSTAVSSCVGFTVAKSAQTITFGSAPTAATYGGSYVPQATGGGSTAPVVLSIDPATAAQCSLTSGVVRFTGAGPCTVLANQAGTDTHLPAPQVAQTFTIGKATVHVDTLDLTIAANETPDPSGAVWFRAIDFVAGDDPGALSFSGAGDCSVGAYDAVPGTYADVVSCAPGTLTSANYAFIPGDPADLIVTLPRRTVAFTNSPTSPTYGDTFTPTFERTPAADAMPLAISAGPSNVCTIDDATLEVTMVGAGRCTLEANLAGDDEYLEARTAVLEFIVDRAVMHLDGGTVEVQLFDSLSWITPQPEFRESDYRLQDALFGISTTGQADCTIDTWVDTESGDPWLLGAYPDAVTCRPGTLESANYTFVAGQAGTLTVVQRWQDIGFGNSLPAEVRVGDTYVPSPYNETTGDTPRLVIPESSSTVCTLDPTRTTVRFIGVGECEITAEADGTDVYRTSSASQYALVLQGTQEITFGASAPSSATYGESYEPDPRGGASSSPVLLTVDPASLGVCAVDGSRVEFIGVGTCTVDADQVGDANYEAAPTASQSFIVSRATVRIDATAQTETYGRDAGPSSGAIRAADLRRGDTVLTSGFTGSPSCTLAGYAGASTGAGVYPGAVQCAAGTLTAPNYRVISGDAATLTIEQAEQQVAFTSSAPADATYGGSYTPSIDATDSPNAVQLTATIASALVCSVDGGTVRFIGVGSCTIAASQPGSANYLASAVTTQTFTVAKAPVHVDAGDLQTTFGTPAGTPTWTLRASDFVSPDTASTSGVTGTASCSTEPHSGASVYVGAVTCAPGSLSSANYRFVAGIPGTLTIEQASQEVSIGTPASATYGGSYTPTITGGASGQPVSWAIDGATAGRCERDGAAVRFTGAGTCTIVANQSGTSDYLAAPERRITFTIEKAVVRVDADERSVLFGATIPAPTATLRPTDFVGSDTATTSGISGVASCSIAPHSSEQGTYPGVITCEPGDLTSANYSFASGRAADLTIGKAAQRVSIGEPTSPVYGGSYDPVLAGGDSGNPVELTVDPSTAAACSLSGTTVRFTAAGTCRLVGNQAGSSNYSAAPQATIQFVIAKATVRLDADPISISYGATIPAPTATPRAADFVAPDTAATSDLTGSADCAIAAHGSDAGSYADVITCAPGTRTSPNYTFVSGTAAALTITRAAQSISIEEPVGAAYGGSYAPAITGGNSGEPVVLALDASPLGTCELDGTTVTFVGVGSCTLIGTQDGNDNYLSAPEKRLTFTVAKARLRIDANAASTTAGSPVALSGVLRLSDLQFADTLSDARLTGSASCTSRVPFTTAGTFPEAIICSAGTLSSPLYTVTSGRAAELTVAAAPGTPQAEQPGVAQIVTAPHVVARTAVTVLRCPAGTTGCQVAGALRTSVKRRNGEIVRLRPLPPVLSLRGLAIGTERATVSPGETLVLKVRIGCTGRALLKRFGRIRANLLITDPVTGAAITGRHLTFYRHTPEPATPLQRPSCGPAGTL